MAYSSRRRWFYFAKMRVDEALLIKSFDSEIGGGTARFARHTAFDDPTSPPSLRGGQGGGSVGARNPDPEPWPPRPRAPTP